MLVTPLPGAALDNVETVLRQVHADAMNARGARSGPGAASPTTAYLAWANNSVRLLRGQIRGADINRLVLSPRYWLLQAHQDPAGTDPAGGTLRALVDLELEERIDALDEAVRAFGEQRHRWGRPGMFVVADTSAYIEAEHKLENLDLAELIGVREEPLHLLIPILVVDELNGQKRRGNSPQRRWRAAYTLALISRHLPDPTGIARLRAEDFSALDTGGIPRGEITIELVFDPPGHVRLPINDDELIDRALAIKHLSGRQVTFLTDDTGQAFRARAERLRVVELPEPPPGDEPQPKGHGGGPRPGR
jgi:hypothetical protein